MNIKTITYDADVYQLVPKVATPDMQEAISNHTEESDSFASIRAAYKAALAAAPQPPELSAWLPIESAPKDGSFFYAFDCDGKRISDVKWCNKKQAFVYWYIDDFDSMAWVRHDYELTHWMPLPKAPEVE